MAQSTATADDMAMLSLQRPGALLRQLGLDTVYLLLALPMGILTFTVVVTGWSLALGLAITLIGLPIAMITIHVSRWMAWVERRRAALVLGETDPRRLPVARPAGSWTASRRSSRTRRRGRTSAGTCCCCRSASPASRSRSTAWSASLGLITMPAWWWALPESDPTRARPLPGRLVGPRLPGHGDRHRSCCPLAAALVRGTAAASGALSRVVLGPSRRAARGARRGPGRDARRRRRRRGRRAAAHRARPARRRAGAARRARDGPRHGRGALRPRPRGRARARRRRRASEARRALAELRDLARGIRPALLAERGLGEAIGALAARTPLPDDRRRSTSTGACPRRSSRPPTSSSPRR